MLCVSLSKNCHVYTTRIHDTYTSLLKSSTIYYQVFREAFSQFSCIKLPTVEIGKFVTNEHAVFGYRFEAVD